MSPSPAIWPLSLWLSARESRMPSVA
jgi:hypothetical protein